jgi:hypothetical protein
MNISVKSIFDYKIHARDGDIGSVFDVLLDTAEWRARYLVVDTGGWLFGRKVLIAPVAAHEPDPASGILPVKLTKQEIKDSPDIASDPPLSREQEIAYHDHYRWPYYWMGDGYVGLGHLDGMAEVPITPGTEAVTESGTAPLEPDERDYTLRSAKHVIGHAMLSRDGELGKVTDFLMDGTTWRVPYLIAALDETRRVLVPTSSVTRIGWPEQDVVVSLTPELLFGAPDFDESVVRDPLFLDKVRGHYGSRVRV